MASLRSQLPDLEAVEPISPVMSDLGMLYGTRVLDPKCLYLIFVFFKDELQPFLQALLSN